MGAADGTGTGREVVPVALGMLGAEFTVLGPPELVDYLRDWADRLTRATR